MNIAPFYPCFMYLLCFRQLNSKCHKKLNDLFTTKIDSRLEVVQGFFFPSFDYHPIVIGLGLGRSSLFVV